MIINFLDSNYLIDYLDYTKSSFLDAFLQYNISDEDKFNIGLQKLLNSFLNINFPDGSFIKFKSYKIETYSEDQINVSSLIENTNYISIYVTLEINQVSHNKLDNTNNISKNTESKEIKQSDLTFKLCDLPMINSNGIFRINGLDRLYIGSFVRNHGLRLLMNDFNKYYLECKFLVGNTMKIIPYSNESLIPIVSWNDSQYTVVEFLSILFYDNIHQALEYLYGIKTITKSEISNDNEYILCYDQLIEQADKNHDITFADLQARFLHSKSSNDKIEIYDIKQSDHHFINNYKISQYYSSDLVNLYFKSVVKKNFEMFDSKLELIRYRIINILYTEWGINGRYNMNKNLYSDFDLSDKNFTPELIKKLYKTYIKLQNNEWHFDSDASLSNKQIKPLSEYLYIEFRSILLNFYVYVKDKSYSANRMKYLSDITSFIKNSVNVVSISKKLINFFNMHTNIQLLDNNNSLGEVISKTKVTLAGTDGFNKDFAPNEFRNVHPSYFGRICCISTTEGKIAGLVRYISARAKINLYGELFAPYRSKSDNKIIYISAFMEHTLNIYIASYQDYQNNNKNILVKYQNSFQYINIDDIDDKQLYYEVFSNQILSFGSYYTLTFNTHNNATRALTAANQNKQALTLLKPNTSIIKTDYEDIIFNSSYKIRAPVDGIITYADSTLIKIQCKNQKEVAIKFQDIVRSNQGTTQLFKSIVKINDVVKQDQIIGIPHNVENNTVQLGTNLLTAVMSYKSFTYEDACVIGYDSVKYDKLTSPICTVYKMILEYVGGVPEQLNKINDNVSYLQDGIIKVGTILSKNMVLASKFTLDNSNSNTILTSNKLLNKLFDTSYSKGKKAQKLKVYNLLYPDNDGIVNNVEINWNNNNISSKDSSLQTIATIYISVIRRHRVQRGDKLAGRVGNKHIINYILPSEDMPFTADGRRIDLIINPLGMISRMNKGQLFEIHYSLIGNIDKTRINAESHIEFNDEMIKQALKDKGFNEYGTIDLYDGITGEKYEKPITVGNLHIVKLEHLAEKKYNSAAIAKYSLGTYQPVRGQYIGGQKLGHMEIWTLQVYGVSYMIKERTGVLSDDISNQNGIISYIMTGKGKQHYFLSKTLSAYISYLKVLGLKLELHYDNVPNYHNATEKQELNQAE